MSDERLAQVVDLGHDVLRALVTDRLHPVESIEEECSGQAGDLRGQGELGPVAAFGHGPVHSTASGRIVAPSPRTSLENDTVWPGPIRGLTMNADSGPIPGVLGS